jgi:ElaA protein
VSDRPVLDRPTPDRSAPEVHRAPWSALDPQTLHDLLRLRIDVFVVEQKCAYPELDGRDPGPGTEHLWISDELGPAAYLRVLAEPDGGRRVGRVCTRVDARGRGLAARLVDAVLAAWPRVRLTLDAQTYVAGFYAARGFAVSGPEFVEDGIPHVPMVREPASQPAG